MADERLEDDQHVDDSRLKLPQGVTFKASTGTGEENEDVLFECRAKYMRMRDGEWKDRGSGDLRFLRDRTTGIIRLLLRQSKTRKARVNHNMHERLALKPHPSSNRVWIYHVTDFSDDEPVDEVFACAFRSPNDALVFKQRFEEFCADMGRLHGAAPASAPTGAAAAGAGAGAGAGAAGAGAGAGAAAPAPAPALPAVAAITGDGVDRSHFVISNDVSVRVLECTEAFDGLTAEEKLYAHYVGTASWAGAKICLLQCSWEAPGIFTLLQLVFSAQQASERTWAQVAEAAGVSSEDLTSFLTYAASFYSNMGNYKSFGDSKFVPGCTPEAFRALLGQSAAFAAQGEKVKALWGQVGAAMYSLSSNELQLGLETDGVSAYYSANITKADTDLVKRFMESRELSPYNTRAFKTKDGFELRFASASADGGTGKYAKETVEFDGVQVTLVFGDYGALMQRVADNLALAAKHAANDEQRAMLAKYVDSFTNGSIDDHKDASRHWIRDKGPNVESYIGFIESYRDPCGVRGEWEGFVAVVNKTMSAKFNTLVDAAESLLPLLPWGAAFEKDTFNRPDFTSLEVVAFGSSGIPAGINIPNYDDIRQTEGFKNVSLGNVLSSRGSKERVAFVRDADQAVFHDLVKPAFEVQVGLHELLGHGSGKLFMRDADGGANFDEALVNPETGEPVTSWYKPGQTWDTVFSSMASTYEECRAECVGIYLCVNERVLEIFGHTDDGDDIVYANWLAMAYAGLRSLLVYNPDSKKWGQAHMQARYVIMNVMREAGIVDIVGVDGVNAESVARAKALKEAGDTTGAAELGVHVVLHRDKIRTAGVEGVGNFLRKLQVYKATADLERAKEMYDRYSAVPDEWLPLRDLVILNRKARPMFVQPHTELSDAGDVTLRTFEGSTDGVINSFVARYPAVDEELEALWEADTPHTRSA